MIDSTATSSLQMQILEANQRLLEQKFDTQSENYKILYDGSNNLNTQVSTQVSSATYTLEVVSVIFTLAGFLLVLFVNDAYRKISAIKKDIAITKRYIDKHNDELYLKLKRNDTLDILKRLVAVPEDISNLQPLLFSRDLESSDFFLLKKAFLSEKLHDNFKRDYILVFQQHFTYLSLRDKDVRLPFLESLSDLKAMLRRDIQKMFVDVVQFLVECNYDQQFKDKLLKNLFLGVFLSEHKDLILELKSDLARNDLDVSEIINIAKEGSGNESFVGWLDTPSVVTNH